MGGKGERLTLSVALFVVPGGFVGQVERTVKSSNQGQLAFIEVECSTRSALISDGGKNATTTVNCPGDQTPTASEPAIRTVDRPL